MSKLGATKVPLELVLTYRWSRTLLKQIVLPVKRSVRMHEHCMFL